MENDKIASWYRDTRAIILAIQRQPGTNTVEVVDSIKKLIPTFREQMPASVNLNILFDRSESIRDSVHDVQFTLILTVCLVVMVIFLFLRNLSATVIPSLALPMSIVGTFAVMYVLDFSMDNMSLMALTLSVGFVVDDAIVMLENIIRHMEMGETVMEAALKGSKEIGFTILSMTISLVAVFLPVFFMGGIIGTAPARVRRHHRHVHPDLRFCLPDAHPHAGKPLCPAPRQGAARQAVPDVGAVLHRHAEFL